MDEFHQIQEVDKLKKRHHRDRRQGWLHWLKRLWKALVSSVKNFFIDDLSREYSPRSPDDQQIKREIKRDLDEPFFKGNQAITTDRPASFLLGLEDIANLEFLTTKEFLAGIEWNVERQEILPVKEEDLTLLDDLLMNFPDA